MDPILVKDAVVYQDGAIVSKEIIKRSSGTVTVFAFDAGQGLSEHTAPFEVLVEILDGEAEITISGTAHTITEGHMIILPAHEPHALKAKQRFKMLLVMLKD